MDRHEESLRKVRQMLPSWSENSTIDDEARATLALVLDPILTPNETALPNDPLLCPNCGQPAPSLKSPYCGEPCREIAGFVRQMRSGLREGTLLDADRQVALGQILWRILGGGLPLRNSLIEPKALARLVAKHEGKCAACGSPATTVDHIGSHCNRTSNLRPMCDACARTKPFGSPELLTKPEVEELRAELNQRITNPQALRPCDAAETWDWRAYLADRKNRLEAVTGGRTL